MDLSYLVSTAGHAQAQNDQYPHSVNTVLQLIDEGADEFGDEEVVGFTTVQSGKWTCNRLSFKTLVTLSEQLIFDFGELQLLPSSGGVVCLLCPTGLDFLIAWIALMRIGYGVVLVAPQCSPTAICNLSQSTSSSCLIFHPKYKRLAEEAVAMLNDGRSMELPRLRAAGLKEAKPGHYPVVHPDSVSHVFHTSGTSGLPKPIPQTHRQSVAVLPRRCLPRYMSPTDSKGLQAESASFTTTPLFHGGISDLLRAWMARSMIYFYPTSDIPITADNVVRAVAACETDLEGMSGERLDRFMVTSFLSVPYILSTLAEDLTGPAMDMLSKMALVSTGGAPLDTATGDAMVAQGVKLVSRLGSSECGFLLSSYRDFESERDWELLRNDSPYADALSFEEVDAKGETARYEMVVTSRWASKTKSNRKDGSYATGDLYERHPSKEKVWRYVGRGDDVIVMSNGEKASPGPIEAVLRGAPGVVDAIVVGSDRAQLGLLLFAKSEDNVLESIRPFLAKANAASPTFAQVSQDMCLLISDLDRMSAIPKSSKGTIQRGVANNVFKDEINKLFTASSGEDLPRRSLTGIKQWLHRAIKAAVDHDSGLEDSTDLFNWGVDSLMATRLRSAMQKSLRVEGSLPSNVVFEYPSIENLAAYLYDRQEGVERQATTDALQLMQTLAARYVPREALGNAGGTSSTDILLTGGTGSLGAHLVYELCQFTSGRIICLVRAENHVVARQRILQALRAKNLSVDESRLLCLAADVSKDHLGLKTEAYDGLLTKLGTVIHAAWPVHFASGLSSFEKQIKGTRNLVDLVRQTHGAQFYFCSSLASVLASGSAEVQEVASIDPASASPIGYSQSKWVVERLLALVEDMPSRLHILRIGQLCGDTRTGYWNQREGWPLMIRTAQVAGCLPELTERPSWLPVDIAARVIVEIVCAADPGFAFHVTHPVQVDWQTVLKGLRKAHMEFDTVSPPDWVKRVKQSITSNEEDPCAPMLPLWQSAYGADAVEEPTRPISTSRARESSQTLESAPCIDVEMVAKMVDAWRRTKFIA